MMLLLRPLGLPGQPYAGCGEQMVPDLIPQAAGKVVDLGADMLTLQPNQSLIKVIRLSVRF